MFCANNWPFVYFSLLNTTLRIAEKGPNMWEDDYTLITNLMH